MIPAVIIAKKRDRQPLSTEEIQFMILGYAAGTVPDYQISALAMAIFLQGMEAREIADLTDAMIDSGTRLKRIGDKPRVDKHSTGGLGDKTSLILAPLLACCDLDVPMISGCGLGITGGTLDKLESIQGFRTNLSESEIEQQLRGLGCVITGATDSLVPADKKLYALCDVTATVPSIPLITASIMSKKIAETLDAAGSRCEIRKRHAFLNTETAARSLAQSLLSIGHRANVITTALLTDMTKPLGDRIGNACEVDESIAVLQGAGPAAVRELTIELGARVLVDVKLENDLERSRAKLERLIDDGQAMERFEQMVAAQGGKLNSVRRLGRARPVLASRSGILQSVDGQLIGQSIIAMGGGRKVAGEPIDFSVGIRVCAQVGTTIRSQDPIFEVYCDSNDRFEQAHRLLQDAITIGAEPAPPVPLWQVIDADAKQ